MKKTFTLIVIVLATLTVSCSRRLLPDKVIRANHISYKTESVGSSNMTAHNENNVYRYPDKKPNNPEEVGNFKLDRAALINAFKKVFGDQMLQQLLPEGSMVIEYTVTDDGKILEVSFFLSRNTIITATELEQLEDAIKNDVTFRWISPHKKIGGFYQLYQALRFNKILDGTIGA